MIWRSVILFFAVSAILFTGSKESVGSEPRSSNKLVLTPAQIEKIIKHGPWPPALKPDPANRFSGNKKAIELGRRLFFDKRLSISANISCATCHNPKTGWTDSLARGRGINLLDRNTQSIVNARFNRWFGWGGSNDNLWAQSIRPIIDSSEMGGTADHLSKVIAGDKDLNSLYTELSGHPAKEQSSDVVIVNIGKILATFQETIVSPVTSFDKFRDALEAKDLQQASAYPEAAQRGAAIFVGKGRCSICHAGPLFTSGEFHNIGISYFVEKGRVDPGRHSGITKLRSSPWTLAGQYSDDPEKSGAWASQQVLSLHRNFGEFRIPSLRNLTGTAPYMHNGSLETLEDVVSHYSEINLDRLHADGEQILKPLNLSQREVADLVTFLKTLSPK
ncbi:MAG: cytochrome-c peroxidase [Methyloligellaceae bacterium]